MKTYKSFTNQKEVQEALGAGLLKDVVGGAVRGGANLAGKGIGAVLNALFKTAPKRDVTKSPGKLKGADKIS